VAFSNQSYIFPSDLVSLTPSRRFYCNNTMTTRLSGPLTSLFEQSYAEWYDYPLNAIAKSSYPTVLAGLKRRLEEASPKLLTDPSDVTHRPRKEFEPLIKVPFRDWNGTEFKKQNILDDNALRAWLGDCSSTEPLAYATKRDPKCRFMYGHYFETGRYELIS
jgi:hypothetical protein